MFYNASPLDQARRAVGIPRTIPLSGLAGMLLQVARRIEPAGLGVPELTEAARVLGGIASALEYEKVRSNGWRLSEGWDSRAPKAAGLPIINEYSLHHSTNRRAYVSEPVSITPRGIHALENLVQSGRWEVTVGAASLHMPGHSVSITLRPRY
jgi:hypothetical protein